MGMGGNAYTLGGKEEAGGLVLEMEHRRKSGRAVHEEFFLPSPSPSASSHPGDSVASKSGGSGFDGIIALAAHPLFVASSSGPGDGMGGREGGVVAEEEKGFGGGGGENTFSLSLTERQRKDREGVVLPFMDAQEARRGGSGEGGRILYDMGSEDFEDFDEEEDEI